MRRTQSLDRSSPYFTSASLAGRGRPTMLLIEGRFLVGSVSVRQLVTSHS